MSQIENIEAMRTEVEALGGTIITYQDLPPHIEEQFLRRMLNRPEYIEQERAERGQVN